MAERLKPSFEIGDDFNLKGYDSFNYGSYRGKDIEQVALTNVFALQRFKELYTDVAKNKNKSIWQNVRKIDELSDLLEGTLQDTYGRSDKEKDRMMLVVPYEEVFVEEKNSYVESIHYDLSLILRQGELDEVPYDSGTKYAIRPLTFNVVDIVNSGHSVQEEDLEKKENKSLGKRQDPLFNCKTRHEALTKELITFAGFYDDNLKRKRTLKQVHDFFEELKWKEYGSQNELF